ncbi:MAG: hypothetical protein ACXIUV_01235 [Alkalilacustris sp.]
MTGIRMTGIPSLPRSALRAVRDTVFFNLHRVRTRGRQSCLSRSGTREIAIVGNGPVEADVSAHVDRADLVIRFNAAGNWGGPTGRKFDVWVISNSNTHGRIGIGPLRPGLSDMPQEIWFTRNATAMALREAPDRKDIGTDGFYSDSSRSIIARNRLSQPCWAISQSGWIRATREIAMHSDRRMEALHPSSGILTVLYCLHNVADVRIGICGFSFSGWEGHDWQAERRLVASLVESGRLTVLGA